MILCDYSCIITGGEFDQIHHLYSFNRIIKRMEVDPFQPGPPVSLPTPIALSKKNAQVLPRTYSL